MKLSRQSTGCQRNRTISRMSCCVYLVQSLNRARLLFDMGITPSDQRIHPADSPQTFRSWFWKAAAIGCAALCVFAFELVREMIRGRRCIHLTELLRRPFLRGPFP